MNTKIFIVIVLLTIVIQANTKQCYECSLCPRPFKGNEAGVEKKNVADDDFCYKSVVPVVGTEIRGNAGKECTPADKIKFCCKGDLCNGATTTTTLNIKFIIGIASLLSVGRFFY